MSINHVSFFSGGGGFDLAAEWVGWENILHCEINKFCRRVLKYYWPDAESVEDIRKFTGTKYRGWVDVLSAGFPCQPFSHAGKREGVDDDRYLWPETLRVVKEIMPRVLVLENVTGLFSILSPDVVSEVEVKEIQLFCEDEAYPLTGTIERIQRRIIGIIIEEIGSAGYSFPQHPDGTPILLCVPACATGAPHRRDRIFFVAYRDAGQCEQSDGKVQARGNASDIGSGSACSDNDQFNVHDARFSSGETSQQQTTSLQGFIQSDSNSESDGDRRELYSMEETNGGIGQCEEYRQDDPEFTNASFNVADTSGRGPQGSRRLGGCGSAAEGDDRKIDRVINGDQFEEHWLEAAARLCVLDDGLSGRLDGVTVSQWRTESLKMAGNAVQPQVVFEIFKAINECLIVSGVK